MVTKYKHGISVFCSLVFIFVVMPNGKFLNLLWTIENTIFPGDTWFGWYLVLTTLGLIAIIIYIVVLRILNLFSK